MLIAIPLTVILVPSSGLYKIVCSAILKPTQQPSVEYEHADEQQSENIKTKISKCRIKTKISKLWIQRLSLFDWCIIPQPSYRVHIPTHQPPVEYEHADCAKIVSKADSTLICSKFMKRSVLVYTQIVLYKSIDQF
ncbi:conserved hypothetical protein [Trichinella spiralis]|uniref:hypothetical protein n=1 Tax=Trichinella spiralis TaxID=6334 RepID=UPI0001EFCF00|nr:conserved hypothetical protein [Trichinella spiralis]